MESAGLRILDANANRVREAVRVIEDYVRFARDDAALAGALKETRHGLVELLRPFLADAILHRDTAGDVGTRLATESEFSRQDLADIVTAAGKRAGEALRVIEELLKTLDPVAAARVEGIRYRFYDIEKAVALTLRPSERWRMVRLCVLITESLCVRPWLETVEQVIAGGADAVQLREKDLSDVELLRRAKEFTEACRAGGVIAIVNDRPDIALLAGADGVHVGDADLPVQAARRIVGRGAIVGVSSHDPDQAKQGERDGADYVAVGPMFASSTKPRDDVPGPAFASTAARALTCPTIAIGGIDETNVGRVVEAGVDAVAVCSAVIASRTPKQQTASLREAIEKALQNRRPSDGEGCDSREIA